MVIFLNLDGTAEKVSPERVFQGSNNVTSVNVIAPFPNTTALTIGFIYPSGLATSYKPMLYLQQDANPTLSVWTYSLPASVTTQMGDLYASVNAITAQGNTTSYLCKIVIEESVLPAPPPEPEPNVYDLILLYLQRLDLRTKEVNNAIKEVRQTAPNAFDTVTLGGTVSAPIVISAEGETPPSPIMATGVVRISEGAWEPWPSIEAQQGYSTTITAAQHGQMKNGAAAEDLWVSFDELEDLILSGAYKRNTKNAAGDITIYVNQPVALTLRVWNGKGLQGADGANGFPGPPGRQGNSVFQCSADLSVGESTEVPRSAVTVPGLLSVSEGSILFSVTNGVYGEVEKVTIPSYTVRGMYDANGKTEIAAVSFPATAWNSANAPGGALSKSLELPPGKRIICVLDTSNTPRGTWSNNEIFANSAFAGTAILA